jgi:predicted Fe-S protein YdhL (DUF1289 family)
VSDAATHVRTVLARVAAQPADAPIPSPCNDVCRIEPATGLCAGCLRTLDEIAAWGSLGEDGRRAVWQRLGVRAATMASPGDEPCHPGGDA